MLASSDLIAFVPTLDMERARAFYRDVLALELVSENPYATVFDANGTSLRVTSVPELVPAPFTILGWAVEDIVSICGRLLDAGVEMHHYEGMEQDELGIWTTPSEERVAWFSDPDGNTLSVTQFA